MSGLVSRLEKVAQRKGEAMASKEELLDEYCAKSHQADEYWRKYDATGSSNAFGNYCAVNRTLSAIYAELVRDHGMTLESVREACAAK